MKIVVTTASDGHQTQAVVSESTGEILAGPFTMSVGLELCRLPDGRNSKRLVPAVRVYETDGEATGYLLA